MAATERLRELLDERGVEWRERVWGGKHSVTTFWHARGVRWHYRENRLGGLRLHADGVTPEQAIAATLGDSDATATRQGDAAIAATLGDDEHTTALATEFVRVLDERDTLRGKLELSQGMRHAEYKRHAEESAKLRERITTQKQTIRAYRDESREWREVAERAQAENAKLLKELEAEHALAETLGHYHEDAKAENAKLREMVRDYDQCSVHVDCGGCKYDGKPSTHCPLSPYFPDINELPELRIEVDA